MKRSFRLKSSEEIKHIRQAGISYSTPLVVLITLPNQSSQTRIAVVASRSVGGAVQRNRCKRLIREAAAPFIEQIQTGNDIIIIARSRLIGVEFEQVIQAIESLLEKSKLIRT
ncbi:MAG: ribonuclease P protein component [Chloroflexota bacterium]